MKVCSPPIKAHNIIFDAIGIQSMQRGWSGRKVLWDTMTIHEEIKPPKHDWKLYFRVEPFKRRGKGRVFRVVRIRDEKVVLRLVKNETRAYESVLNMLDAEIKIVERLVERTLLG
jgi:hypothetical protein